jgi:hypothetical protein
MNRWVMTVMVGLAAGYCSAALADEPNEVFTAATVLAPGVRNVSDELTASLPPDTVLGVRDLLGQIDILTGVDDDSSPVGSGTASALSNVATNSGAINFAVTGFPNYDFEGGHSVSGEYQVFVEVFDDFHEDPIASFEQVRTLEPDVIHEFSYFNDNWVLGTYNVYIDNTIGPSAVGDVDYFTFTGLTPGEGFTVETLAPMMPAADTYLGWFDAAGVLIGFNDDIGGGNMLSSIAGTVPADGRLTFGVTGVGDDQFSGEHVQQYAYQLQLTTGASVPGDFNGDSVVNGDDLAVWRDSVGPNPAADADGDNDSDGADFLTWQRALGGGAAAPATLATPEPSGALLMLLAAGLRPMARACRRPLRRN